MLYSQILFSGDVLNVPYKELRSNAVLTKYTYSLPFIYSLLHRSIYGSDNGG